MSIDNMIPFKTYISYNKAVTYINLPDIKRLCISKEIAHDAEENGIDWYEIWPDLEYFEVTER